MSEQELTCGETHLAVAFQDGVGEPEPGIHQVELGEPKFSRWGISSAATITAQVGSHQRWATRVTAYGYGTSDHTHAVVCLTTGLALILGPYALCLDIPSGALLWNLCCDEGGVFGIYPAPGEDAVVAHTETSIQKLSATGEVLWLMGGRDIFTGPFEVGPQGINITDFTGDIYAVQLDTGASAIIGHGPEFPHTDT